MSTVDPSSDNALTGSTYVAHADTHEQYCAVVADKRHSAQPQRVALAAYAAVAAAADDAQVAAGPMFMQDLWTRAPWWTVPARYMWA